MSEYHNSSPIGLDIDPEDDPEFIFSQPLPPVEDIDPSLTDDPSLRSLQINVRRLYGLPDYPEHPAEPRSAAD